MKTQKVKVSCGTEACLLKLVKDYSKCFKGGGSTWKFIDRSKKRKEKNQNQTKELMIVLC